MKHDREINIYCTRATKI